MIIYALSGPPGAGKTTFKNNDPKLSKLPFLDVADVYLDYPGIQPTDAFSELLNRICIFITEDNAHRDLVVEAVFREDSKQRTWLDYIAQANEFELKYIELDTPLEVCLARVEAEWKASNQNIGIKARYEARKSILTQYIRDEERQPDHQRSNTVRNLSGPKKK